MEEWDGLFYRDDRLYFLDLVEVDKHDGKPWSVITRKNIDKSTPVRIDSFKTREEAILYIKKVEPGTPRISLGGKSPKPVPSYGAYCAWLEKNEWPSALDIYFDYRDMDRDLVVKTVSREDFERKLSDASGEDW